VHSVSTRTVNLAYALDLRSGIEMGGWIAAAALNSTEANALSNFFAVHAAKRLSILKPD
jgi:hypothetical protein